MPSSPPLTFTASWWSMRPRSTMRSRSPARRPTWRLAARPSSGPASTSAARPLQNFREKRARAFLLRIAQDVPRLASLDDDAAVHEDQAVADFAGEAHFMGDDHHRHAVRRKTSHDVEHVADELRVQG